MSTFSQRMTSVAVIAALLVPALVQAQAIDEQPNAARMAGDLIVARPIGLVATILGTGAFVVSLPFTLAAGSVEEAAQALVVAPARTTFVRCLGCTQTGYTGKDREAREQRAERRAAKEADAIN